MASSVDRLRAAIARVERSDPELAQTTRDRVQRESLGGPGGEPESIIHRTQRPVLLVAGGDVVLDLAADSEIWRQRLRDARANLQAAIPAVGRIEVENHALGWVGTGWLVEDTTRADQDVVVTNRHVAREFARRNRDQFVFRQGVRGPLSASVDFLGELGRVDRNTFRVDAILHIEDDDGPDVAFLRVVQTEGSRRPAAIKLATEAVVPDQHIAVIGYPARDHRIADIDLMIQIFGDVFDSKRVAPGQVQGIERGLVLHDCSTLGGNSGSVVLDLATGKAIALHFSGRFLDANYAVPAATVGELLAWPPSPRPAAPAAVARPAPPPAPEPDRAVVDAELEARPEDYAERPGYDPDFIGTRLPLPDIHDDGDVLRFWFDGEKQHELRYQHFSVVMSQRRRLCWYSAVNIDGGQSRRATRPAWRRDPRIDRDAQTVTQCYGNAPRFARGHMTRREDPIWGPRADALRGCADSMHLTNAVPQMQTFNAGIWLELEDYALEHTREDAMRVSVITGPVLDPGDPMRYEVQIPRRFWKVILFVHDQTGEPCITGYTLDQSAFLREEESVHGDEEFVYGPHHTAQVSIAEIERLAGVSFPDELRRLDPLDRAPESRPGMLDGLGDIRFR